MIYYSESDIAIVIVIAIIIALLVGGIANNQSSGKRTSNCHCKCLKTKAIDVPKPVEFLTNSTCNNDPGGHIASTSTDSTPSLYTLQKLQYFGSDRYQIQKARAGYIINNSRRDFCIAAVYNLDNRYYDCHVAIAEAFALWNGLKLAKRKNVRLGSFQGRNEEIRDRVLNQKKFPPKSTDLTGFIEEIQNYFSMEGIDVESAMELVEYEEIGVARALAIEGGLLTHTDIMVYESVQDLPQRVLDLLNY